MIRYMVKNNIKMMLRSKWILLIMTVGPILVISLLGAAFDEMMKSYEGVKEFSVGYRVEENGMTASNISSIKEAGKLAGIEFVEYPEGDISDIVKEYRLKGFVSFSDTEYTIYNTDEYKAEGTVLDYFVGKVIGAMHNGMLSWDALHIEIDKLDYMPSIDAQNYYGIAFLVYYIWCGFLAISSIVSSERKNQIERRFYVSSVSGAKIYLSKLISATIANFLIIAFDMVICTWWFDVRWGSIPITALTISLNIMAAIALGLLLYYMFNNLAVTIIVLFVVVWFCGFVGGAFETYMFSSWPEAVKRLSPIYMANRILIDYALVDNSDYLIRGWLYFISIIAGCSAAAVFVEKLRKKVTA